jgi:hypothetical protein
LSLPILRHPRARRYTIRVRNAYRDVVLTMPKRGSLADAHSFAQKNAAWIAAKLAQLPDVVPFAPGEMIPFRGVPHRIEHRASARGTAWVEQDESGNALLCVAGDAAHVTLRVSDFLKREAKKSADRRSRVYAASSASVSAGSACAIARRAGAHARKAGRCLIRGAHPRPGLRAGLSRGARNRASHRTQSFGAFLEPARFHDARSHACGSLAQCTGQQLHRYGKARR